MSQDENGRMSSTARMAISIASFLLFMISPALCFAQNDDEEQQRAAAEREAAIQAQREAEAQQTEEIMRRGQEQLDEFLKGTAVPPRPQSAEVSQRQRFREFRQAIPKFRNATEALRWALGSSARIEVPSKEIGTQTEVFLKYLKGEKLKPPRVDSSEFKDFTKSELVWETLNSAEKIAAYLDIAVRAEQQQVVTTKTLEFLNVLNRELKRLKWLTSHVR